MGRDLAGYKEITMPLPYTDISHSFSCNAEPHQRSQKITVGGVIALVKSGAQANKRRIFVIERICVQIIRQIYEHFSLGIGITAEGMQLLLISEQVTGHIQLPFRQETGIYRNILTHTHVDFVPYLCQKDFVLRRAGDFVNVTPVHYITMGIIPQLLRNARKFFLFLPGNWVIIAAESR